MTSPCGLTAGCTRSWLSMLFRAIRFSSFACCRRFCELSALRACASPRYNWFDGVPLDQRVVLERAQRLVRAGDDLLPFVEAGKYLDVGGAGDARGDRDEGGAELALRILIHDKHTLVQRGFGWCGTGGRCSLHAALGLGLVVIRVVHGERLDGNGKHIGLVRRGDLGGGGEARAQLACRVVERDDHLEVLGFFSACGRRGGGLAGGTQERLVAD